MNPNPTEIEEAKRKAPLTLGIPTDLVFDDDPLEHLLYGAGPIAPTPASVAELWEQRLDRSEACARALAAVLARNPDLSGRIRDRDGVEQCLRPRRSAFLAPAGSTKLAPSFNVCITATDRVGNVVPA